MKHKFLPVLTAMLMIGIIAAQAIKVHTIGDSTMAQYDPQLHRHAWLGPVSAAVSRWCDCEQPRQGRGFHPWFLRR